ncbi:MAG: hypothetical protein K6T26_07835 [Alicyclobacillus sp.]|nr:hypothetical protein [Alicyclobacillus sp.]
MIHLLASGLWLFSAWRWGDWRHWERYHATILYLILGGMLYDVLTHDFPMWRYQPDGLWPNHLTVGLRVLFVTFPCTVLLYLPHYPPGWRQCPYVLAWAALYSTLEWGLHHVGLITYHNGWRYVYSVLFNLLMFTMLRLHFVRPLWAYGVSVLIVSGLVWAFGVPVSSVQ